MAPKPGQLSADRSVTRVDQPTGVVGRRIVLGVLVCMVRPMCWRVHGIVEKGRVPDGLLGLQVRIVRGAGIRMRLGAARVHLAGGVARRRPWRGLPGTRRSVRAVIAIASHGRSGRHPGVVVRHLASSCGCNRFSDRCVFGLN